MPQKIVDIPGIGEVVLAKRRGAKNLRLTIHPSGRVRVGLPSWAPYSSAVKFAQTRAEWINQNLKQYQTAALQTGDLIGKSHRLKFVAGQTGQRSAKSRLSNNLITITSRLDPAGQPVQAAAVKACERALKIEAQELLGARLAEIASQYGFRYQGLLIKRLTSRWGSCSQDGVITLSHFLVQLPWHLIDYVILHELVHTEHHNHGPDFWTALEKALPGAKRLKKEIKSYRPVLLPG